MRPSRLRVLLEQPEESRPAALGRDRLPDLLGALAHPVEPPVLELDARRALAGRREGDLDLARLRGVGIELPIRVQLPREDDPLRRLVLEDPSPIAFGSVRRALEPAPARPRLD